MSVLEGSERASLPPATDAGPADQTERLELTLVLRRRAPGVIGASTNDISQVRNALGHLGLTVTEVHNASRRVKVAGTLGELAAAFGTTVRMARSSAGVTHRYRQGALYLPDELDGIVTAVLGLDNRPQARPHFRLAKPKTVAGQRAGAAAPAGPAPTYTSADLAAIYGFPAGTTGAGQTIALVELGGGYTSADLSSYCSGLGIPVPTVTAASVDGATNSPGSGGADVEVALDIEVICGAAPGAAQVVYFAPNSDQGFVDAVSDAAHATPAPVATLGITVCVAAGDNGSSDGASDGSVHVDFPASSPHALACGGTRVIASGGAITSETVWNDGAGGGAGGGGISDAFPVPSWQASAGLPGSAGGGATGSGAAGRGVPDVAGNADPETGYNIVADGQPQVVGGTSAVAPLWAALVARLAQATGSRFGQLQPALYAGVTPGTAVAGLHDITQGSNGAYNAGPGWDACTGLGSPDGPNLLTRLSSK